mgnify:CR=1 FL=1
MDGKRELTLSEFYNLLEKFLSRLFLTEKVLYLATRYKEVTVNDILQYYSYLLQDFLTKDLKIQIKTEKEG